MMAAIWAGPGETISEGNHLRWFLSPDLELPEYAFLSEEGRKKYRIPPPAFHIFRREHYSNYEHKASVPSENIIGLLSGATPGDVFYIDGIKVSVERGPEKEYSLGQRFVVGVLKFLSGLATGFMNTYIRWAYENDKIIIKFPRTIHLLKLTHQSSAKNKVEFYADDDDESVRLEELGSTPLEIDQGHYDKLVFSLGASMSLDIDYTYMDEDANRQRNKPGEWNHIDSTWFITRFLSWSEAKDHCFPPRYLANMKNRYIDFDCPNADTNDKKLDLKYGSRLPDGSMPPKSLFERLLEMFRELRNYSSLPKKSDLLQGIEEITFDPYELIQVMSIDPLIATLLGICYSDVKDVSQIPPDSEKSYDYMVLTDWHPEGENSRLSYIVLNVSEETKPILIAPTNLREKECDGVDWEGRRMLRQVALDWDVGERETLGVGNVSFEPVAFDVERTDVSLGSNECITHYCTIEGGLDVVVDTPVVISDSFLESDEKLTAMEQSLLDELMTATSYNELTQEMMDVYDKWLKLGLDIPYRPLKWKFCEWIGLDGGPKVLSYRVRGIDIFGRYSDYQVNPVKVTVTRPLLPPEVTNVQTQVVSDGTLDLDVRWQLRALSEIVTGETKYFNVVYRTNIPTDTDWRGYGDGWTDLTTVPIVYQNPINMNKVRVGAITDLKIKGKVVDCTQADQESIAPSKYIFVVSTDQCFYDIPPVVDFSDRYKQVGGAIDLDLDQLEVKIDGTTYTNSQIVGFEGGRTLRLTIAVDTVSEGNTLMSHPGHDFELKFNQFKEFIQWTQKVSRNQILDVEDIDEEFASIDGDSSIASTAEKLQKKMEYIGSLDTIRLSCPDTTSPDVTGRESWFTNGATIEYEFDLQDGSPPVKRCLSIDDYELTIYEDNPIHMEGANSRTKIKELNIGSLFWESTDGATNQIPVFPANIAARIVDLISTPGATPLSMTFRILRPKIFQITTDISSSSPEGVQLSESMGGELSFLEDSGELNVAEVLMKPCIQRRKYIGFLIRCPFPHPTQNGLVYFDLSALTNPTFRFHRVYRTTIADLRANAILNLPQPQLESKDILLAISSHTGVPATDANNPVSTVLRVRIPPEKPTIPFAPLTDPFDDVPTSFPKIIDGQRVIQYEVELKTPDLPPLPLAGDRVWEVLRAPEDAVRALMIMKKKENPRTDPHGNPNPDADPNVDDDLSTMTSHEARLVIANRLINSWTHQIHNLQRAFSLVGKVDKVDPPKFVDTIEGTASGGIYYAVREFREGAEPGDMSLLKERAEIVDTTPPPAPKIRVLRNPNGTHRLLWRPNFKLLTWKLVVRISSGMGVASFPIPVNELGISEVKGVYKIDVNGTSHAPPVANCPRHDFTTDLYNHWDTAAGSRISPTGKELVDIQDQTNTSLLDGDQVLIVYKDNNGNFGHISNFEYKTPFGTTDLHRYEIYSTDKPEDADDIRNMNHLDESPKFLSSDDGPRAQHAPLMIQHVKRDLVVLVDTTANLGSVNLVFPHNELGIAQVKGIYRIEPDGSSLAPLLVDCPAHDFSNDPNNFWDTTSTATISGDMRSLIDIPTKGTLQKGLIRIVYQDGNNEYHYKDSIEYHRISLEGIPENKIGSVNGIFPMMPLTVLKNKIFLLFDTAIHGITNTNMIGIFNQTDLQPDGTLSSTARNYWEPPPAGNCNVTAKFIEGISSDLQNGTDVVIKYNDGVGVKTISTILEPDKAIETDISKLGLLPGLLHPVPSQAATQDPPRVANELRIVSGQTIRTRNLRILLATNPVELNHLQESFPARVRFGTTVNDFDTGMPELEFLDASTHGAKPTYRIISVRKVRIGSSHSDYVELKSRGT